MQIAVDLNVEEEEQGKYIVAVSKCGRASCLHKVGGCWRARGLTFRDYEVLSEEPAESHYQRFCRNCWPKKEAQVALQGDVDSEIAAESSIASSSS